MGFNGVGRSPLHYAAGHSASNLAGTKLSTNLDGGVEERLAERARIGQDLDADCASASPRFRGVPQVLDRVLEPGGCVVEGLCSPSERIAPLGDAFASVPNDLGFPSAVGFRVVVHGRQRNLRTGLLDELYCIGREAIINAYRHSRAKHIEAEIEYRFAELRIAVRDNGCGIDPWNLQRHGHWGLQGMLERSERIGARLRIWSKLSLGTEVDLCVPSRVAFDQIEIRSPAELDTH
jgi:hypothetical protein